MLQNDGIGQMHEQKAIRGTDKVANVYNPLEGSTMPLININETVIYLLNVTASTKTCLNNIFGILRNTTLKH